MTYDFNRPIPSSLYVAALANIVDGFHAVATGYADRSAITNVPDKTIGYNPTAQRWEIYSIGTTSWSALPLSAGTDIIHIPQISDVVGQADTSGFVVKSTFPSFGIAKVGAAADGGKWDITAYDANLHIRALNDAVTAASDLLTFSRVGMGNFGATFSNTVVAIGQNISSVGDSGVLTFRNYFGLPFSATFRLDRAGQALTLINSAYTRGNFNFYDSGTFAAFAGLRAGTSVGVDGDAPENSSLAQFGFGGYGGQGGKIYALGPNSGTYGRVAFVLATAGYGSAYIPLELGTDGTLRSTVDGGIAVTRNGAVSSRFTSLNSVRNWSMGVNASGVYAITDETAVAVRVYIQTDGTLVCNAGTYTLGSAVVVGALNVTGPVSMSAGATSGGTISTSFDNSAVGNLEVRGAGGASASLITFHRPGVFGIKVGLDSNSSFVIGGWSGGIRVYWDTAGNLVNTGDVTAFSDVRHKRDITPISDILGKLASVDAFTFTDPDSGERRIGISAQSARAAFPEAVRGDDTSRYSFAYGSAAMASVVMLGREVAKLRGDVAKLKLRAGHV